MVDESGYDGPISEEEAYKGTMYEKMSREERRAHFARLAGVNPNDYRDHAGEKQANQSALSGGRVPETSGNNAGADGLKEGVVVPKASNIPAVEGVSQGGILERAKALLEFRRARKELEATKSTVANRFGEQTHDEEGNLIPNSEYLGGLHLGGTLPAAELVQLEEQVRQGLGKELQAWDDIAPDSAAYDINPPGSISPNFALPIVPIPHVEYSSKGMSRKQIEELQRLQESVLRSGSVTLGIGIQPTSTMKDGGSGIQGIPEALGGLSSQDSPDTKVEVLMSPGFKTQRETAAAVFGIIKSLPLITARSGRLSPRNGPPQLPPSPAK